MAIYRNVQTSFWTDVKIADDFNPEDRYFYLYLFTNPHTNLCGCYEVSVRILLQRAIEELRAFEKRYSSLKGELEEVFEAIEKIA